ncbi:MAG: hypothetical protein AAFV62_07945 [Pseudomonadota bacterium]
MPRIGAYVRQLGARELRERVLVNIPASGFNNAYDAGIVWTGQEPALLSRVGSALTAVMPTFGSQNGSPMSGAPGRFPGLRAVLETHYRTRFEHLEGDVADAACRAVPFEHVAIYTPDAGFNLDATEANLRTYFREQLGRHAERAARVRYLRDPSMPEGTDLRVQFGFGVFLPEPSDLQIGRLLIAGVGRDDGPLDHWAEPRIGGDNGQAAGFYRGQAGLAFSSALRYAPAVTPRGVLPDRHLFFFGRYGAEDPPRFESFETAAGLDGRGALKPSGAYAADRQPDAETPTFAVRSSSGRPAFFCRWTGDESHSALRRRAPEVGGRPVPHLQFEGLVMPEAGSFRAVRQWWVDFTTDGRLAVGALDESAYAVASGPGQRIRLYNRATHDEVGLFRSPQPVRLGGGQELRQPSVEIVGDSGSARWRHRLQALKQFGHLEIGRAPVQRIIPFRSESDEELSLDWLNHCGGVYARQTDDFGAPQRQGLAEWSLAGAEIWLSLQPDERLFVRSERLQRTARLSGQKIEPIEMGKTAVFLPGEDLLIGCHHFRYVPGG